MAFHKLVGIFCLLAFAVTVQCYCGDNIVNLGEQCDGFNLNGEFCDSVGNFDYGNLACNSDCTFDTSDCSFVPYLVSGIDTIPANGEITVGHAFHIRFILYDYDSQDIDVYINWGDGSKMVRGDVPDGVQLDYWHIYDNPGEYCIMVCLDDESNAANCDNYYNYGCNNLNKKSINYYSAFSSILASVAGDPYFYGFDGQVFKFVGENSHVYNLISSPAWQLNALLDRARSANGVYTMPSVIHQVGVMWEKTQNFVSFAVDNYGSLNLTAEYEGVPLRLGSEEDLTLQLGSLKLHWEPHTNFTRENSELRLSVHEVQSRLTLNHPAFYVELLAVKMPLKEAGTEFYFVDLQVDMRDRSRCYEGVWGRTSCVSCLSEFDRADYDVKSDKGVPAVLGMNFPKNLFLTSA